MSKADNMLSILWMLRSGKKMTARQIADELEIHVRTVYRASIRYAPAARPSLPIPGRTAAFGSSGSLRNPR